VGVVIFAGGLQTAIVHGLLGHRYPWTRKKKSDFLSTIYEGSSPFYRRLGPWRATAIAPGGPKLCRISIREWGRQLLEPGIFNVLYRKGVPSSIDGALLTNL